MFPSLSAFSRLRKISSKYIFGKFTILILLIHVLVVGNADVYCLLLTVNALPEEMQCTVHEMLKELESDKATGRFVVWLRFTRVITWQDCKMEGLLQFFQGELFCCNSLLIY